MKNSIAPGMDEDVREARKELIAVTADDTQRMSVAAGDFVKGLDRVNTVMIMLSLKFGRATAMMRVILIGLFVGNILFAWSVWEAIQALEVIRSIDERQSQMLVELESGKEAALKERVAAQQAREAAPRVVVDQAGTPKLVVRSEVQPQPTTVPKVVKKPKAPKGVEVKPEPAPAVVPSSYEISLPLVATPTAD